SQSPLAGKRHPSVRSWAAVDATFHDLVAFQRPGQPRGHGQAPLGLNVTSDTGGRIAAGPPGRPAAGRWAAVADRPGRPPAPPRRRRAGRAASPAPSTPRRTAGRRLALPQNDEALLENPFRPRTCSPPDIGAGPPRGSPRPPPRRGGRRPAGRG